MDNEKTPLDEKEEEKRMLDVFFKKEDDYEYKYTIGERYAAGSFLIKKIAKKIEQLERLGSAYNAICSGLQLQSLEDFKNKKKAEFVEMYYSTRKKVDQKMIDDFLKLEAAEKHSCYVINGIEIFLKDCKGCKKQCERYFKFVEEKAPLGEAPKMENKKFKPHDDDDDDDDDEYVDEVDEVDEVV